jgi:hypothetical protein
MMLVTVLLTGLINKENYHGTTVQRIMRGQIFNLISTYNYSVTDCSKSIINFMPETRTKVNITMPCLFLEIRELAFICTTNLQFNTKIEPKCSASSYCLFFN